MSTCAAGELAHRGGIAPDRLPHLVEVEVKHVVEQEGGALQRRKPLEHEQERQGDVINLVAFRLHDGLGQPGANIYLACLSRRL